MTHDPNKKTLRSFQCRDYLWDVFNQMAAELDTSIDYLINESMRQYARSRNYGTQPPPAAASPSRPPPPPRPPAPPSHGGYGQPPGYPPSPPGYPSSPGNYPAPSYGNSPMAPPMAPPPMPTAAPSHGGGAPLSGPPPLGGAPAYGGGRPQLYVIFNGQKIPIGKDEFVIGRGSKTADLPIKDGNISRRHASVVFQGGAFYIKDLGSTNGIEYGGRRIESKRIEEGDAYQICDYELRFTYR